MRRPFFSVVLAALVASGCFQPAPGPRGRLGRSEPPAAPRDVVRADWGRHFAAYDATGAFVLYDARRRAWSRHDPDRAARRFTPASTFKLYNALVALDAGVVPDVDTVFAWDGVQRDVAAWNQDHSLRTGMAVSAVWLYQLLARRNGEARFAAAMRREPYGNNDRSCGLDRFWLDDCLRISADEQVLFIDRLRQNTLAFRHGAQTDVREIIRLEAGEGYTLYGKTGWGGYGEADGRTQIGWLVGWIERPGGAHVFALNVEPAGPDFDMVRARRGILDAVLADEGLRPLSPARR